MSNTRLPTPTTTVLLIFSVANVAYAARKVTSAIAAYGSMGSPAHSHDVHAARALAIIARES